MTTATTPENLHAGTPQDPLRGAALVQNLQAIEALVDAAINSTSSEACTKLMEQATQHLRRMHAMPEDEREYGHLRGCRRHRGR